MPLKPLKRYGQNFLRDPNISKKIADLIVPQSPATTLEIGPGEGALTRFLVGKGDNYIAVEIDPRAIDSLKSEFRGIHIMNEDFLKSDLKKLKRENSSLYIYGNIPYNITNEILFKLCANFRIIKSAVLMIQLDAAKRITAEYGSKDYNASNIIFNAFADIEIMFNVSKNAFYPKPNVESAVVKLSFRENEFGEQYFDLYSKVVKEAFTNRRKVLKNSPLNKRYGFANFIGLDKYLSKRPEELTVDDYHFITETIFRK